MSKFSNFINFCCCWRKVLLNYKTSFPCEKLHIFQSDLNISQILTNVNGTCDTNMAFHIIFSVFLKNKNSLETLIAIFVNSSPKSFSWQNIEKSEISILSGNSLSQDNIIECNTKGHAKLPEQMSLAVCNRHFTSSIVPCIESWFSFSSVYCFACVWPLTYRIYLQGKN